MPIKIKKPATTGKKIRPYASPRWSNEVPDCSVPLAFDQYNICSYNCLYCFSYYQRSLQDIDYRSKDHKIKDTGTVYTNPDLFAAVPPERIAKLLQGEWGDNAMRAYVMKGLAIQWGSLSDPFDENERKHGIGLEIMREFAKKKYPLCFSTKGTWWTKDDRYVELFREQPRWNVKMSIINLDSAVSSRVEERCPSPANRLLALERVAKFNGGGGVTLRLRPFIIGMSDADDQYLDLIEQAAKAGATALSTEFFCLERRARDDLKARYAAMSEAIGMDLVDFYVRNSKGAGYLRLNWKIKKPYIDKMERICTKLGVRFYVSDAHHKDRCANGSCCGLPADWPYQKGQFTEALMIAKKRGKVTWSDISDNASVLKGQKARMALSCLAGVKRNMSLQNQSLFQWLRGVWNNPNGLKSPYKYFGGLLQPLGKLDRNGDVVYKYVPYSEM